MGRWSTPLGTPVGRWGTPLVHPVVYVGYPLSTPCGICRVYPCTPVGLGRIYPCTPVGLGRISLYIPPGYTMVGIPPCVYALLYTPGYTPLYPPCRTRYHGNTSRSSLTALEHEVTVRTVTDGGVTMRVTDTRFTVGGAERDHAAKSDLP